MTKKIRKTLHCFTFSRNRVHNTCKVAFPTMLNIQKRSDFRDSFKSDKQMFLKQSFVSYTTECVACSVVKLANSKNADKLQ